MRFFFSGTAMLLLIAPMFVGCGPAKPRPLYNIYMANRTHHDFDGVGVFYDGKMAAYKGVLVAGGKATYGHVIKPIPDEAVVHWIDAGGRHAPKVKLAGVVPAV